MFVSKWSFGPVTKKLSKVIIRHFIIIVASHTLWTYAAIQNGSQFVEKVNKYKLLVCPADDSKVWLIKICHKWLSYTDHAYLSLMVPSW